MLGRTRKRLRSVCSFTAGFLRKYNRAAWLQDFSSIKDGVEQTVTRRFNKTSTQHFVWWIKSHYAFRHLRTFWFVHIYYPRLIIQANSFVDHVVSLASGHQRSERRGGVNTGYVEDRNKKITDQHEEHISEVRILDNVRVYINGYLSDTTDIEFKRIVCLAGGRVV